MMKNKLTGAGLVAAIAFFGLPAFADEEVEAMVQDALPVMYHTCASVIAEADGDDLYVLDVIEKMTALSLSNREINVDEVDLTDDQRAKIRETFLAALGAGCKADNNALLAGVVDNAVKSTLGL